jgi:biotin carboxylase
MSAAQPVIAIVDAYSSGARLPGMLAEAGWRCLHVQSTPEIPAPYRKSFPGADAFAGTVVADGALGPAADRLRRAGVERVIAGAETGVVLQDALNAALDLPGNPVATSQARRDKYAMQARLQEMGVAHIPQVRAEDAEALIAFADAGGFWPLLVKPLDSAGGDGVTTCHTRADVRVAAARLLDRRNALGLTNRAVLGQQRLTGAEYVVNAVFREASGCVSEIWRIHKAVTADGRTIYDHGELLASTGDPQDRLHTYFMQVAEALQIREGAAHAEIMLTQDGPVLIEVGARLAGSVSHRTTAQALGHSHPSLFVESLSDPARFRARCAGRYVRHAHAQFVSLISHTSGTLQRAPGYAQVAALPSFVESINPLQPGDRVERTVDLFSSPGLVYLCHREREQIDADRARIRDLERTGFFVTDDDREPGPAADRGTGAFTRSVSGQR